MDVRLQVGLNFRRLRLSKGLTQEQAADLTGASQQYISGLERGRRNPTVLTLHELTGPLDAEPLDLLQIIDETD
ncbi:helix-turn-helix domain-containing protein [Sphingopyxis sp. RIFCSPHIGHO2_12_FULL_65_19]|uniref:helix-turn-helix domain-containing protein n=1 Tax=Sphingopyxis sp. RIFCSPHIGHO2_12_FULL_65_19 TaxID=1802172 RepID=UPI0008CE9607|nr:helix-turn-helix transcriptional regulator [Sphingopyxis sp. RIFCSPHIGHO2_12_FULL_65_19]OHD05623.1 MAG: transcriptional regulator [Sphingopyxis sp. RIFCSPHIGHO2_12_FULL_65_19]